MIDFEAEGSVAVTTMNRPEARNAVNSAISSGLEGAVDRLEADGSPWLGIPHPQPDKSGMGLRDT